MPWLDAPPRDKTTAHVWIVARKLLRDCRCVTSKEKSCAHNWIAICAGQEQRATTVCRIDASKMLFPITHTAFGEIFANGIKKQQIFHGD